MFFILYISCAPAVSTVCTHTPALYMVGVDRTACWHRNALSGVTPLCMKEEEDHEPLTELMAGIQAVMAGVFCVRAPPVVLRLSWPKAVSLFRRCQAGDSYIICIPEHSLFSYLHHHHSIARATWKGGTGRAVVAATRRAGASRARWKTLSRSPCYLAASILAAPAGATVRR